MPLISTIIPVYRDSDRTCATLDALWRCGLPYGHALETIVVDDGSQDGTAERLVAHGGERIRLIVNARNLGRATARNRGAAAAQGEWLLFLDGDCAPAHDDFLATHLHALATTDVSVGSIRSAGKGFWHDYQLRVACRRRYQAIARPALACTSANVAIARRCFERAKGFDERYRDYGFEDRALAFQLERDGARFAFTEQAAVTHLDTLELAKVCTKLRAAGGANAALFTADFPEAYRQLGYALIDARLHHWLRLPSALFEPLREPIIRWLGPQLERPRMPFRWRATAARVLVAASYLRGTVEASSDNSSP